MSATRKQILKCAYREARQAGLDIDTAYAVSESVMERVVLGGETYELVLVNEIAKHASP